MPSDASTASNYIAISSHTGGALLSRCGRAQRRVDSDAGSTYEQSGDTGHGRRVTVEGSGSDVPSDALIASNHIAEPLLLRHERGQYQRRANNASTATNYIAELTYGWSSDTGRCCCVMIEGNTRLMTALPLLPSTAHSITSTASSAAYHRSFDRFLNRASAPST